MFCRRVLTGALVSLLISFVVSTVLAGTAGKPSPANETFTVSWSFDDLDVGQLPAGWMVESTNGNGDDAVWRVVTDETDPSKKQVLALVDTNHNSGSTFNLCWTDSISFRNGEISVRFRADQGREDQGGGVIWRVQDADNYYIARFNPLEDNFRLYSVRDGRRKKLASARMKLAAGQWHELTISQHGDRYEGSLNGKLLLAGTDDLFGQAGGVGLWTKADAATSFDDFLVTVAGSFPGFQRLE